jgi:flagellar M-ring protein FliF
VFDTSGNLLSEQTGSADAVPFPDSTLSYQTSVERNLERKVQDLVDAMIGKGHTLIRISATLDFSRNETTSERYDPDETVVRSEQIERQPVTDTDAENPPEENVASRYRSSVATSSQVEYEISKTTRRTVHPVGELKQLAVTILVTDQKMIGDDGRISYQPRSEEDLEAIRSLVAGALPLKPERGDTVQMGRVDVERLDETLSPAAVAPLYDFVDLVPVGKIIIIVIFFVLFYWLLLKPIIGFLRSEMDRIVSAPVAAEQQADDESRPEAPEEDIGVKLKEDVRDQPLAAAHIIRRWIQEA